MGFDRWAIVEGHYWFCADYYVGQGSDLYYRLSRISRYFKPGVLSNGPSTEESCIVYNELERKHGFTATSYEVTESGEAKLIR